MKNRSGWLNRALMLTGCGVLALCLSGCIVGGERELRWNGLVTKQQGPAFWPKRITSFWSISYTPEPGTPIITIRMPDGRFIPANDLNRDTLAPYVAAGTADELTRIIYIQYSRGNVVVWPDKHGNPENVVVEVNRAPTQGQVREKLPAISTPDGATVLEFPLQEEELEDLLGKPTKDERRTVVTPLTV